MNFLYLSFLVSLSMYVSSFFPCFTRLTISSSFFSPLFLSLYISPSLSLMDSLSVSFSRSLSLYISLSLIDTLSLPFSVPFSLSLLLCLSYDIFFLTILSRLSFIFLCCLYLFHTYFSLIRLYVSKINYCIFSPWQNYFLFTQDKN